MANMARRFVPLFEGWQNQPYIQMQVQPIAEPDMWPYIHARDEEITGLCIWDAQPFGEPSRINRQCDVLLFDDGSSVLRRWDDMRPGPWSVIDPTT